MSEIKTGPNWLNVGASTLDNLPPFVRLMSPLKDIKELYQYYFEGICLGWSCEKMNGECLAGTILGGSFAVGSLQEGIDKIEEKLR